MSENKYIKGYQSIHPWMLSQIGVHVHCPTKFIHLIPAPVKTTSGLYGKWAKLKKRSLRPVVFRNWVILILGIVITFIGSMILFVWMAYLSKSQLVSLGGGWVTFSLTVLVHELLTEQFPTKWYLIKSKK